MNKKKIVIIDDDPDFTAGVESILQVEGFAVVSAVNGREGMAVINKEQPDLLILDVMMEHDTEGFELARAIRQDPVLNQVPIVMVTGIRREMNLPFAFERDDTHLPVSAVLEKPAPPEKLLNTVKTLLEIEQFTTPQPREEPMETAKKITTVLIVDDNPEFAEATRAVLDANEMTVKTVENGTAGFDAARTDKPDLILLDVMMEDAGAGLDTLRKLKEDPATADIPVFLVTGIKKPQFLLESYAPGEHFPNVKKYLEKPVAPEALLEAINTL